jgi:hypothetical protein
LALPSDFSLYHARRHLIAKQSAASDPVKREQINILIEQLTNYDPRNLRAAKSIVG